MKSKLVWVLAIISIGLIYVIPKYVLADFYVIPTGTRYKHPEIVSAFKYLTISKTAMMTVPAGKTFILTDIVSHGFAVVDLFEDDTHKTRVYLHAGPPPVLSIHFQSGIPFASGTDVVASNRGSNEDITIAGYFIDN